VVLDARQRAPGIQSKYVQTNCRELKVRPLEGSFKHLENRPYDIMYYIMYLCEVEEMLTEILLRWGLKQLKLQVLDHFPVNSGPKRDNTFASSSPLPLLLSLSTTTPPPTCHLPPPPPVQLRLLLLWRRHQTTQTGPNDAVIVWAQVSLFFFPRLLFCFN
jgi:hypothetical protein